MTAREKSIRGRWVTPTSVAPSIGVRLDTVKAEFTDVEAYYHIGDTELDQHYTRLSAFEFEQVQTMEPHPWMLNEAGEADWGPNGRGMVRAPSATTLGLAVPPSLLARADEVIE